MYSDIQSLFEKLGHSKFRSGIHLKPGELNYFREKGIDTVMEHGRDFINTRLAPANPPKDGKQTPWGNHPVFVAQHATATCCRGCLEKWHEIPKNTSLSEKEKQYILEVIRHWLVKETHTDD